jgi:2-polyprenyl-3-methyl-5-hydroxy-6-metoxy-1,4-benzoquinol methylase
MAETCDICNFSDSMKPLLEISLMGTVAAWVHRCARCGFRQIRPRMDTRTIARIYPAEYFHSGIRLGYSDFCRQDQRYRRAAYFLSKRILKRIPPDGRLLEIGCALGFMLDALKKYTSLKVEGLDISPFAAYFAKRKYGIDVACGTLKEAGYRDEIFDFIIQKDLLEHVTHPREHMLESNRILKKGGYTWLVTPNGEMNIRPLQRAAAGIRQQGVDHLPVFGQGHLSFFSKNHLLRIFEETGFECVSMRNISLHRGLRDLGWMPFGNSNAPTISRAEIALPARDENPVDGDGRFEQLYDWISEGIQRHFKPIRSRKLYFYQRQFFQAMGRLPAPFTVGLDFEFLLRKQRSV